MAGDWIAWTKGLTRKREIHLIARRLSVSRREAAALCMEAWEWADAETADGGLPGAMPEDLDAAVNCPGLADALREVGWLILDDDGLRFPNWDYWNSESAKHRLVETRRKQAYRAQVSRESRDAPGTEA